MKTDLTLEYSRTHWIHSELQDLLIHGRIPEAALKNQNTGREQTIKQIWSISHQT